MSHHCHWPGCIREVPPKMWGCSTHWFRLPAPTFPSDQVGFSSKTVAGGAETVRKDSGGSVPSLSEIGFEKWLAQRGDGIESTGLKRDELLTCWLAALEFAKSKQEQKV